MDHLFKKHIGSVLISCWFLGTRPQQGWGWKRRYGDWWEGEREKEKT